MYALQRRDYYIGASYAWVDPCSTKYGGTFMNSQKHLKRVATICAAAIFMAPLGCGDDPAAYQSETLTYENPASSNRIAESKAVSELDLSENQKSDFGIIGPYDVYPWGPYPFFGLDLIPVPVPVFPGIAVTDFVHPFYAFAALDPFWDDDNGLPFRDDDDGRSRRDDD